MATAPLSQPQGNPLAGVASLLQTLGGTNRTVTTSPGDISYLQQVFQQGQQFDPNLMLQTIFQQAGGQIPGFQRAFGNSVGARSGNNSAVAAALQKLLMDTTVAAQDQMSRQILQNNQNQGNVAGNIATATRGQTQTEKSGTNLGKAAQMLALWQLAGKTGLVDQIGKGLGVGGSAGGAAVSGGSAAGTAPVSAPVQTAPLVQSNPVSSGMATGMALPALGSTIDTGLLDQPGMGSMEWTNGATLLDGFSSFSDMFADQANNLATMEGIDPMDALMGVTDGFGTIPDGGSNFIDDIIGTIGSWFGFADGSLVGRDGEREIPSYANGGPVRGPRSNVNTMQTANPLMMSANNQMATAPRQQVNQPGMVAPGAGAPGIGSTVTGITLGDLTSGTGPASATNSSGQTASPAGLAAVDAALGVIGQGMVGNALGMIGMSLGLGPVGALGLSALGKGFVNSAIANNSAAPGGGYNSTAGISAGEPGVANDFGAVSSPVSGPGDVQGIDLGMLGGTDSGDMGGTNGGSAGDVGVGEGDSSSSDAGFGGTLANGGPVSGPGTGTSDSIMAMLSDGEYVIPADVVDTVGVEFFDALREAFHQPAAVQR